MSVLEPNSNPGDFARGATVLGRYVIDRCLRRERLASVYAARDQSGLWVSVWAARRDQITRGADSPERFARAVAAVAALAHPALPALLAWDIELDAPIIASALKPGRSLRDVITSDGFIPIDDVARVTTAVGAALHALHRASPPVAHGGVSPERVQLSDDGRVWLEEAGYLHALVEAGLVAPAQAVAYASTGYALPSERVGRLDAHADTFQLAVLAFEALTGQLPFGASQPSEVSAALSGSAPPTPSSLRLGLSHELDELFLEAWRAGQPGAPASVEEFARELARVLGEDRNRRPTFPGGESPSRLRPIDPQLAALAGRPAGKGASALDTVDRAFDAMLSPDIDPPPPLPAAAPSKPPVIEFGATEEPARPAAGVVDVTPVKPTLVGATPTPPEPHHPHVEDRPAVSDQATPSVGYERLKLLAADALRDVDTAVQEAPAEPRSPDATTRIEDDVLDALRKTTLAARAQQGAPVKREVPRAHGHGPPSKASVPPPPDAATRPSASQFPTGRRRKTSKPPKEGAATSPAPPAEHEVPDHTAIPKAPRLPNEVHTLVGHLATPPKLPSTRPDAVLEAPEPIDEVAIVATQDILEADIPEEARRAPEPIKPSAPSPPLPVAASSAESTQLTGTPLPPKPAHSHRPPPVPEASHSHRPPPVPEAAPERHAPPKPSTRPAEGDDVITAPIGPSLRAPPPPKAEARDTRPPGDRTSVTQTIRASQLPPSPTENSWAVAAKWCAVSTVVSALLVTAGFVYLRDTHRELIEELRLAREQAARAPAADAAPPAEDAAPAPDAPAAALDAATPDATPAADATAEPAADVLDAAREIGAAPRPSGATDPTPAVTTPPSGDGVPDAAARARMSGAMRGAISDCVEGVEDPPFVLVGVRYDGRTGAVTRVRLHGPFQEAPMGPCIEHAVREVRAPAFAAAFWETEYRFPVPQPRWRPGQPQR